MPDLRPWHADLAVRDFRASDGGDFASYLEREARVFESLDALTESVADAAGGLSRFNPEGAAHPARFDFPGNRTRFDAPKAPRGGALLLHGLSDSPYSLRAVGEILRERQFAVLSLRLPGHGAAPGALARARWRDWRAAVRIAARHLSESVPPDRPIWLVGYSNGAALAVDHTLALLAGTSGRPPDRLVLLSPALAVTRLAAFAGVQRALARLPGLTKLGWTDIQPEYDPFKFNSFPIEAGEQIHDLTGVIHQQIAVLANSGVLAQFPPVIAFQSLADATIPPLSVVDQLFEKLPQNGSELVLFDLNRVAAAEEIMREGAASAAERIREWTGRHYDITIVANADARSRRVVAQHREATATEWTRKKLRLEWPAGVYSLSHVAVPFPPDDPLYGSGKARNDDLRLGSIELRGERGVLLTTAAQLMRLRHNPFFDVVRRRLMALAKD